jgi:hypothetical protein
MPVLESKVYSLEVQIKGNPFVKKAPTKRTIKVIERSADKMHLRIITKTSSVPYCDCFYVEEEWFVVQVTKSCAFRVSYTVTFVQSTMMKGMIKSSTDGESKAFWQAWNQIIADKGFEFV